ncbi:5,10-methylenetetrahydrofolate reductase / Homolog of homocysteine-binding domain [Candidatus Hydrogenisulfobacillus filiaventi]|uniref:5,10-methylenetetrahydrofolate reductase / Homolog of homocysteine-binding domain n=1 Tax=Candidatus Hydrogenisulfobacillus filiaventi TaxID=2707344 RepID=A0A6F8ZJS5_9FIRM|nr:5,10-methylenetetrahydrofolate reductase / Homolog of homocysteine-binding domain [Candidatus Hydrogenisulfobacillus filiaventi]
MEPQATELEALLADPRRTLIGDGALGTWLAAAGVAPEDQPWLVLRDPDRILDLHLAYLQAGARLLETATFLANRVKLAALGREDIDVYTVNRRAAQLARHARDTFGEPAWVLGSLGPLGPRVVLPGEEAGPADLPYETAYAAYREAVSGLVAGGVDGFIVETLSDLGTARAAVAAIRAESALPVVVTFAFSLEGTTLYGLTPEAAAEGVLDLPGGPPAVVGANCGTGPSPLLDAVLRMAPILRGHGIRLAAIPNAGQPHLHGQALEYPASPDYMATLVPALKAAGCAVIGGCCGTTPAHIAAMAAADRREAEPVSGRLELAGGEERPADGGGPQPSPLESRLQAGRFVISVELDPPRGANPARLLAAARTLAAAGVDAVNVADSPMARVRMSAMATGRLIREAAGLDIILHFTTRDRNLMGLESDLLGAYALGMQNILCLTGDPPALGDYAASTAVYDLDSVGLVQVLQRFKAGEDSFGHSIGQPLRFLAGVGANPNHPDLKEEAVRVRRKLEAGADFIMTQPLYDAGRYLAWLDAVGPLPVPVLVGVMPLVSYRQAEYLHHEVPGIDIPEAVREAMRQAGQDGARVGMELALAFLEALPGNLAGIYLVPSFNKVEPLLPLIEAARRRYSRAG